MEHKEVVIKRPLFGNILLIIVCAIFVALGIWVQQTDLAQQTERFFGILSIIFFGGGGLFYIVFMAWKPIVVISSKGIMVPYGWGKTFVPWDNVDRFEVVEQTVEGHKQKYIGIFVNDTKGIVGAGKITQAITQNVTGWNEVPALTINLSFSFVKIEKVMVILQGFYAEYRNTQRSMNDFTKEFSDMAEEFVSTTNKRTSEKLDFSIESLKTVEELLDEAHEFLEHLDSNQINGLSNLAGAYIFEVARRNFGGKYYWYDNLDQPILVTGQPKFEVSLLAFEKAKGRIINGLEDNIPFFFDGYVSAIKRGKSSMIV